MLLGLHCDVRGGYEAALKRAEGLRCEAMQILTYRRHHEPTEEEFASFRAAFRASPVKKLVLHVRFLPALASEDRERRGRSVELLAREIGFAKDLGGACLVFHLGAFSPDSNVDRGMEHFSHGVCEALERSGGGVPLVVENVPGGGRRMGGSLEELAEIAARLDRRGVQVKICLDTAHAWAYGYELDSQEGMRRFLGRAHRLIGAENIPLFHLNDTRAPNASHRENHCHWGEGFLGTEGMKALFARKEYREAVGILEMPPADDRGLSRGSAASEAVGAAAERDKASLAYVRDLA